MIAFLITFDFVWSIPGPIEQQSHTVILRLYSLGLYEFVRLFDGPICGRAYPRGGGGGKRYMWVKKMVGERTDIVRQNENLHLRKCMT